MFLVLFEKPVFEERATLEGPVGKVEKAVYSEAVDKLDCQTWAIEDCDFSIDLFTFSGIIDHCRRTSRRGNVHIFPSWFDQQA